MAFVLYHRNKRSADKIRPPQVSIGQQKLTFNAAAAEMLGKAKFVRMAYDADKQTICIWGFDRDDGAMLAICRNRNQANLSLCVSGFIRQFGLGDKLGLWKVERDKKDLTLMVLTLQQVRKPAKSASGDVFDQAQSIAEQIRSTTHRTVMACAGCDEEMPDGHVGACSKCGGRRFDRTQVACG